MSTNKIITCQGCGQKNKIDDQLIGQAKCGKCGLPLKTKTNLLSNPIILIIFPAIWILLQTKVYYYMGFAEASGGALAIFGIALIIPLIIFAVKKFKQKAYPNFVMHAFIGTVIVFALALVSYMDSHNWKLPSPAGIASGQDDYKLSTERSIYSKELNITVSDDEVAQRLDQIEHFKKDGIFDIEVYKRYLVDKRLKAKDFEDTIREDLIVKKRLVIENEQGKAITHISANTYPGFEENKKGCERNDPNSCNELGRMYDTFGISMYVNYERIPINYDKAAEYYKKACDLDNAEGCAKLAFLYHMNHIGNDFGLGTDYFKANQYTRKGCELNDGGSCTWLGISYADGTGVKQNYTDANKMYYLGCELGDNSGCYHLGMAYKEGKGVKKDYKKAKNLFGMSCDMKYEDGCKEYAILNK